jgi:tetratricopeptide (TPR) repeat protein
MWGAMADAAEAEEPGSGQFVRQMKESLGDEGAKHFLHLGYDMMPQKPVGVGAIWHRKESVKVPFVGTMRSDSELELTGIEETSDGKVAHIAITSDTRSGKGAETVLGPVSMTFRSMDLRQEGTIRLNADTGLLLDSESKTSGGMRLIVRGPDGKRVSGTMKLSMTEETSVRPTLGKFPEAIAEYEKASKLGSVSLETLADAYKRQGDWEKAIATYKEAARRSPDLHVKLGDLYRSRGMLDEAIAEYDASEAPVRAQIERGSANANGYNELAWFYVTKKIKPQEAVSLAEKAVELAPADATILDTLRWAYLRNGQFAEALETFRKILVSQPGPRLSFSGWRAVAEIARSSIEGGVFLRFCDDMNELSKSMADKVASEHTLIWVQSVLAQFHEHRGEKEKAEEQWRKAGFIKTSSWLVIGPFDNVGGSGFFKAYPPEQSIDLHATYQARGTKIGWAELNPDSYGAFVDLEEVLDDNQWAVAYAFARVHSAQETQAQLRVGSDDDVKVWLNGKEVLSTNVARVAVIDQDIVSVNLKEGTNEILLKVCNRAGGWGFHLRITDSQGRPLEGLGYIPAAELRSTVPK